MTFEEARRAAAELLENRGQLLNGHLLRLVEGDKDLFREVREALIRDRFAEDRSGIGLALVPRVATNSVNDSLDSHHLSNRSDTRTNVSHERFNQAGIATIQSNSEWWVMADGVTRGPFDNNTIRRMIQLGEIVPGDVVRQGREGLWQQPSEFPALTAGFDSTAEPDRISNSPLPLTTQSSRGIPNRGVATSTSSSSLQSGRSISEENDENQRTSGNQFVPPEKVWSQGTVRDPSWLRQGWNAVANLCGGSKRLFQILLTLSAVGLFVLWWRQPPPSETIYKEFNSCYTSLQKLRERRIGRSEWAPTVNRLRPRVQSILGRLQFRRTPAEKELYQAGTQGLLPLFDIPADPTNAERIFDKHMASARRILDSATSQGSSNRN